MPRPPRRLPVPGLLLAAAVLIAAGHARAAIVIEADEEVIVQPHEVIEDDLVVFAPYVRVDGVVKGDLSVVGSDVVVEGIVEQDLLVVAKSLYLNGSVSDDARVVVYALALGERASVADDLFGAGYSLEAKPGSHVGGSLYAVARQMLLAGQVVEQLTARSGALELRGLTGGRVWAVIGGLEGVSHSSFVVDLDLELPVVPDGLTITGSAAIGGDLEYRTERDAHISPDATIAGAVRQEPWGASGSLTPPLFTPPDLDFEDEAAGHEGLERLALLLVLGLLLAVAVPGFVTERAEQVRAGPADLLGWGLVAMVGAFLIAMLVGIGFFALLTLAITTGLSGLAWSAVATAGLLQTANAVLLLLSLVYLGPVLASAGLGRALLARIRPGLVEAPAAVAPATAALVLGAVVYAALRVVPWLGPLVGAAGALIGLGAITRWLRDRFL